MIPSRERSNQNLAEAQDPQQETNRKNELADEVVDRIRSIAEAAAIPTVDVPIWASASRPCQAVNLRIITSFRIRSSQ